MKKSLKLQPQSGSWSGIMCLQYDFIMKSAPLNGHDDIIVKPLKVANAVNRQQVVSKNN